MTPLVDMGQASTLRWWSVSRFFSCQARRYLFFFFWYSYDAHRDRQGISSIFHQRHDNGRHVSIYLNKKLICILIFHHRPWPTAHVDACGGAPSPFRRLWRQPTLPFAIRSLLALARPSSVQCNLHIYPLNSHFIVGRELGGLRESSTFEWILMDSSAILPSIWPSSEWWTDSLHIFPSEIRN